MNKTLNSISWSFIETIGNQGLQFIIGIILARLLIPEDFGIVGVLALFLGISNVLIDSGFRTSIIRDKELGSLDCSSIFYLNIIIGLIISIVLFFASGFIADYFQKPSLKMITQLYSIIPMLNAFGLVPGSLLYKNLKFKLVAKISVLSNFISGVIGIILALMGFNYWALVWRALLLTLLSNTFFWLFSNWKPELVFSHKIIKKHFAFSSKLLVAGLFDSFFDNVYSFVIGKFFTLRELGYFTRGKGYVDMATKTLSITIQKVNTPLLAFSGKNSQEIFFSYQKLLNVATYLIFPVAILMIVTAKYFILLIIGPKWLPAAQFIQILSIAGMIYPILNANSAYFSVIGRSDYVLKSTLVNRPIQLALLFVTINFNVYYLAWGIVIHFAISLLISYYFLSKITNLSIIKSLNNILRPALISCIMGIVIYIVGLTLIGYLEYQIVFLVQIIIGIIIIIISYDFYKIEAYLQIKNLLSLQMKKYFK